MRKEGALPSKQRDTMRPSTTEEKRPIGANRKDRKLIQNVGGSVSKVSVLPHPIVASQYQKSSPVLKASNAKTKPVVPKTSSFAPNITKKSAGKKLITEKRRPSSATQVSTPASESTPTVRARASSMIDRTRGKIKLAFNMNEKSTSSISRYWKKQVKDHSKLSSSNSNLTNQNINTTLVPDEGSNFDLASGGDDCSGNRNRDR
jgi:hypothetical protein